MKKVCFLVVLIAVFFCFINNLNVNPVNANGLTETVNEQIEKIDLSKLEDFYNSICFNVENNNFNNVFELLLNGKLVFSGENAIEYVKSITLNNFRQMLPSFISVIAIVLFCAVIKNVRSSVLSNGVYETVFFVCYLSIVLILSTQFITSFQKSKKAIETLAKLNEIMSPILLTLMLASGGNVSASVYKPAVVFLSNGVINLMLKTVLPIVTIITILGMVSNFSPSIKLNKLVDFFSSVFKWLIGLIISVYGLFISIQGVTSASFDGISIKAAKYAISNSVPIVGGLLKDGFDLVIAGSVVIKNSIGVVSIFLLFYIVISPVLYLVSINALLKLVCAIIEPVSDDRTCSLCVSFSKSITYLIAIILSVGLMFFITVFLMIISANGYLI